MKFTPFVFASLFLLLSGCSSHNETPVHSKKQESVSYQKKNPKADSPLFNEDIMHASANGWQALYVSDISSVYLDSRAVKSEGNVKSAILVHLYHVEDPFIIQGLHEYDCSTPNKFKLTQMKMSKLKESKHSSSKIIQKKEPRWELDEPRSLNSLVWKAVCEKTEPSLPVLNTSSTFADLLNSKSRNTQLGARLAKDGFLFFRER